jgi:hypothetical protein
MSYLDHWVCILGVYVTLSPLGIVCILGVYVILRPLGIVCILGVYVILRPLGMYSRCICHT